MINEDGHQDVASAVRQCKIIAEDAMQILQKLQTMSPEDSLPTWWTNKLAVTSNSMNKMRDYLLVPSVSEEFELDENVEKDISKALGKTKHKVSKKGNKVIVSVSSNDEADAQRAMKNHPMYVAGKLRVVAEEVELDEAKFSNDMIDKLKKTYEPLKGKKVNPTPLMKIFDKIDSNKDGLEQLYKADIPFVSMMAMSRLMLKHNYKAADINKLGKIRREDFVEEVELEEVLKPKDKKVVDAFYDGKSMEGNTLSTDGKKLTKGGLGAQTIATSSGNKFKIVAKMDGKHTQSVVSYIKKSFPKNVVESIKEEVDATVQSVVEALSAGDNVREQRRGMSPTARAKRDAMRDMDARKKGGDDEVKATDADREKADRNIINKLKKAADVRGNYEIKFDKGPSKKIPFKLLTLVLKKLDTMKPADKLKFQKQAEKSYADFLKAVKDITR